MSRNDTPSSFLSRWARLKRESQPTEANEEDTAPLPDAPASIDHPALATEDPATTVDKGEAPPPSMEDVETLTFQSDFQPFLKANVTPDVKNAAMKKLFFSDPHFNTMDGLDIYIEDYNATHQPLPLSIIKKLASSKALALFDDAPEEAEARSPETPDDANVSGQDALPPPDTATLSTAAPSDSDLVLPDADQPDSSSPRVQAPGTRP